MPYKYNPFTSNLDFYEASTVSSPVTVAEGGTGNTTLTDGSILVGDGTNPIEQIGPLTDGQLLIGDTAGVSPATAQLIGSTGLTVTNGPGSISIAMDYPVSIANGGTGASDATEGFDALSPTTTKGDLIASDGSDNIRLAVGADAEILTADSTQASGVKWAAAAGGGGGYPFPVYDTTGANPFLGYNHYTGTSTTSAITSQRLVFTFLMVGVDTTITAIGTIINVAVAGSVGRLGIYNSTSDGHPGTLLLDAGTIALDATGPSYIAISQALTAGTLYYGAMTIDENSGAVTAKGFSPIIPILKSNGDSFQYFYTTSHDPTVALPDPAAVTGEFGGSPPAIIMKA